MSKILYHKSNNSIALRKFFEELSKRRRLKNELGTKSISPEISLIRLLLSDNQTITRQRNLHTRFGVYSIPYWVNNKSEHIADILIKGGPQIVPSQTDKFDKTSQPAELNNEISLVNIADISKDRRKITYNQLLGPTTLKFFRNDRNIKNAKKSKVTNKIIQKNKLKDNRVQEDSATYQSKKHVGIYVSKEDLLPKDNLRIQNISRKKNLKQKVTFPSPIKDSTSPKHGLTTDEKNKTKQILQEPIVMDNTASDVPFSHSLGSILNKRHRKRPEEHSLLKCRTNIHKHSQSSINKDDIRFDITSSLFKKTVANLKRRKKGQFGRSSIKSFHKVNKSDWIVSSDAETEHSMDSFTRFSEKYNKLHKKRRHSKYSMRSTDDTQSHSSRDSFAIFDANYDREFKNLTHQPHRPPQVSIEVQENTRTMKGMDASSSSSSFSGGDSLKQDIKIEDLRHFQRDSYKLSIIAPINQEDLVRSSQQRGSHDSFLVEKKVDKAKSHKKVVMQLNSVTDDLIIHRSPSSSMSIFDDKSSDGKWNRANAKERRQYYESRVAEIMTRVEIRAHIPVKKPRNFLKEALHQKWKTKRSQTPIKHKIKDKYPTKLVECTKFQAEGIKPFKIRRYIYQDNITKKSPEKIEKTDPLNLFCQPNEEHPPCNSNMKKKSKNLDVKSYCSHCSDFLKPGGKLEQTDFKVLNSICNCKRLPRSKWPAS